MSLEDTTTRVAVAVVLPFAGAEVIRAVEGGKELIRSFSIT